MSCLGIIVLHMLHYSIEFGWIKHSGSLSKRCREDAHYMLWDGCVFIEGLTMTVEDFRLKARMGTQPFPSGEWKVEGEPFPIVILADGKYERKRNPGISAAVGSESQLFKGHKVVEKWLDSFSK